MGELPKILIIHNESLKFHNYKLCTRWDLIPRQQKLQPKCSALDHSTTSAHNLLVSIILQIPKTYNIIFQNHIQSTNDITQAPIMTTSQNILNIIEVHLK